ncbi:MAG: hypothetical protein KC493_09320 [Bacteriovoracaceae bacterium]|nr:hypothetical protein [Bacteriovoracaceae bacterium]
MKVMFVALLVALLSAPSFGVESERLDHFQSVLEMRNLENPADFMNHRVICSLGDQEQCPLNQMDNRLPEEQQVEEEPLERIRGGFSIGLDH